MPRTSLLRSSLLILAALACALPAPLQAQRSERDWVLDRYLDSMGGRSRLAAIRSVSISGTLSSELQKAELSIMKKRPDKVRTTITIPPGIRIVNAYDGETAWTQTIGPRVNKVQELEVSPYSAFVRDAALESPLAAEGFDKNQIDYRGLVEIEGDIACHLLVVTYPNGAFVEHFLDSEEFYERKTVKHEPTEEADVFSVTTSYPSDFRYINGVVFSFRIEMEDSSGTRSTIDIDEIRINPGIIDSIFTMPRELPETPD